MSQKAVIKKAIGIHIIASLFLLAPFGNILISFAGSGIQNWYNIDVLFAFLLTIPLLDWLWLSLLFITGLLLFRPHKLTWSIAIGTLVLVLLINAIRLYQVDSNSIDPTFLKVFSVLAIISTLSILVIAMYFRYPYLDRRSKWLSEVKRLEIRTSIMVNDHKAQTESLSNAGCRISFDKPCAFIKGDFIKLKFTEISRTECQAEVVEKLEFGARVEFKNLPKAFRQDLDRWLKSHS